MVSVESIPDSDEPLKSSSWLIADHPQSFELRSKSPAIDDIPILDIKNIVLKLNK